MNTLTYFQEQFNQLQRTDAADGLIAIRKTASDAFNKLGIPTTRNEEWKYTRIGGLFNKEYQFDINPAITSKELDDFRLPAHAQANEIVFVNGLFSSTLSTIRSSDLIVLNLEDAAKNEYRDIVTKNLGHSVHYANDGINALNTAFAHGGVFVQVKKGKSLANPIYIYHVSNARSGNSFSQPRGLIHVDENAGVQIVETFVTLGEQESFTNQILEIVVQKDARVEYYKIQNDKSTASQVSTTHIRQVEKSFTHSVVISLDGNIIRNNLNVVFDADHCESHLYGLYCLQNNTHVDNHTVVDNAKPSCFSNELYKGVVGDNATGIFNGKIFVRKDAQKTNAYQSNKNILISETASVNAKPQLEIFADDVKCSHGCTVGSLDEEAQFYLVSRGLSKQSARALLLQAFAMDILENIKPEPIRKYVEQLISERLEIDVL
ncbi:MAG: Fe-S cluster assembly protein SufD [Bacteroidetes bacterium]|nr:Fe-S cluster assembly protein SufD [Bacteroidota bacterium]